MGAQQQQQLKQRADDDSAAMVALLSQNARRFIQQQQQQQKKKKTQEDAATKAIFASVAIQKLTVMALWRRDNMSAECFGHRTGRHRAASLVLLFLLYFNTENTNFTHVVVHT